MENSRALDQTMGELLPKPQVKNLDLKGLFSPDGNKNAFLQSIKLKLKTEIQDDYEKEKKAIL